MESEKVKEIKKALEDNANYEHHNKLGYIDGYKCKTVAFADILTLINELESENETIKLNIQETEKASFNINQMNGNLVIENQQLKDRIAELEKENALIKNSVAMRDYKTLEEISNNKVKQFAEKLKNKLFEFFQDNEELDGKISVGPLYVDVIGVEAKDGTIISLGLIDKLLKECLND